MCIVCMMCMCVTLHLAPLFFCCIIVCMLFGNKYAVIPPTMPFARILVFSHFIFRWLCVRACAFCACLVATSNSNKHSVRSLFLCSRTHQPPPHPAPLLFAVYPDGVHIKHFRPPSTYTLHTIYIQYFISPEYMS